MKNIKIVLQYDGTKYNGWQKQGNTNSTIQGKLEEIISRFFEEEIEIVGSGRTDAGVHAKGQVANFHISNEAYDNALKKYNDNKKIRNSINEFLPMDIKILSLEEADLRFHARLNARRKHYRYIIDNGDVANVFERKYMARYDKKVSVDEMLKASKFFIGEHDFKSFCANKKMKKSTVRTVYDIQIKENNGIITMDFYGNGFLYNMVRIMVGTLIEVGDGRRKPSDMQEVLDKLDRSAAGFLAPASGLFLEEVYYE